jgi:hypothetical protein
VAVEQNDSTLGVEYAQALRHVVERRIQAPSLVVELGFRLLLGLPQALMVSRQPPHVWNQDGGKPDRDDAREDDQDLVPVRRGAGGWPGDYRGAGKRNGNDLQ